ncbi:MAG: DNA mismatch repair protein MutS [Syntrophaceae bacterium]|nr:DNA mismatch repair protein MutS [Syntrophaceae bacterium]
MKAFLLHRDRDFDLRRDLPPFGEDLVRDLGLDTLFDAMAAGDPFVREVARKAVLTAVGNDAETIRYRQDVLRDCLRHPSVIRELYAVAEETLEREKKSYWGIFSRFPSSVLYRALEVMEIYVGMLRRLKAIQDTHGDRFESEGFRAFFAMIRRELGEDYFARVRQHLDELKFRDGLLISAGLDRGNRGTNYVLRKPHGKQESWLRRVFSRKPPQYTVTIHERDESGARALSELRDRGIHHVADALARSADHILSFFSLLRAELAFYVGCLNLHDRLSQLGGPTAFPLAGAPGGKGHAFRGLYDACLALTLGRGVVSNGMDAGGRPLVIITGANQGGKTVFLRSIGLSQLMMQSGMFVPAESFRAGICDGLFTHFKREEDPTMKSGKLDEELARMSAIAERLTANAMVLFNESFAATNEREGSEIARQITCALVDRGVRVYYVTHLYAFARGLLEDRAGDTLFLRAERLPDGGRTFRIVEGEPLQTSYGKDLYDAIFGRRSAGPAQPADGPAIAGEKTEGGA